ncbi:MAG: ATP-dependent zinc metalloprotease FtsH [Alphaproteobacteria bacterium]|nr:ATP-dependent zinc metalloprotease FtsH [Alphaproteobacteria bacterium]MBR6685629.1 ATP-dependent zinc metalloprotease FtsH [Alphaproteobacteria bacterium]
MKKLKDLKNARNTTTLNNKPKRKRDIASWALIIFSAGFLALMAYTFSKNGTGVPGMPNMATINNNRPVELTFSDILRRAPEITTMNIRDTIATGTLSDGTKYTATITYDPEMLARLSESGTTITIDTSKSWFESIATFAPLLLTLLFIFWILRGFRRGGAGGIGRSLINQNPTKIATGKPKTTFKDVAGIDSEKQELSEIVDFLKNKDKYKSLGARVPRGVLLSGQPGTGKTLLARAIAGEADVPFFAASGSDFSGIIVGLGVAKIKEIFEMAKRNAPCILFIDEIDAIGQKRSTHSYNDQDREQTLNQLLIEMDGFANDTGIIVIGATNRADMLDAALLRPGRFDRQVYIELPDMAGRREILDLYAKRVKIGDSVNLQDIARGTTGFSGADLENLLNEAALHAVRNGRDKITSDDIEEARDKIIMGPRKIRKMRPEDIKLTAYHEAGHAFISLMYDGIADPIHKATIIPRGRALGMVQHLPIDDKVSMTLAEVRANLSIALAGRCAEEIFFGADKITTGAESDIAMATRLARYSITTAGLSKRVGLAAINQVGTFGIRGALENASEKTAEIVDAEIRSWLDTAHADATKHITKNKKTVEKLANALLEHETLTGDEIREIVFGKTKKATTKKTTKKRTNATKTGEQ